MDRQVCNGLLIQSLCRTYDRGFESLFIFHGLLTKVQHEGCWQDFLCIATDEVLIFDSFEEFAAAPAPFGLGTTIEELAEKYSMLLEASVNAGFMESLDALKAIWGNASAEDQQAFLAWLSNSPDGDEER